MLTLDQTVKAAWLAGYGATGKEIAAEIGYENLETIRRTLGMFGTHMSNKPFGVRPARVDLAPEVQALMDQAADARGLMGPHKADVIVERLLKILGSDPGFLDAVINDGVRTGKR